MPSDWVYDYFEATDLVSSPDGIWIGGLLRSDEYGSEIGLFTRSASGWSYERLSDGVPQKVSVGSLPDGLPLVVLAEVYGTEVAISAHTRSSESEHLGRVEIGRRPTGSLPTLRTLRWSRGFAAFWIEDGRWPHRRFVTSTGGPVESWTVAFRDPIAMAFEADGVEVGGSFLWVVGQPSGKNGTIAVRALVESVDPAGIHDVGLTGVEFRGPFRIVGESSNSALLVGPTITEKGGRPVLELAGYRLALSGVGCGT